MADLRPGGSHRRWSLPKGATARETLRLAVFQLVPLDHERIFESRVWLTLTAEALTDEKVVAIMWENAAELRANLARLIDLAKQDHSQKCRGVIRLIGSFTGNGSPRSMVVVHSPVCA